MGYVAASIRFINLMKRKVLQIPALILEIPMTNQISGLYWYLLQFVLWSRDIISDTVFNSVQVRKLEFLIAFLVFTMAACFFVELSYAKPSSSEVLKGLFVPQLKETGATGLAISLLGAMVMPYGSCLLLSLSTFILSILSCLTDYVKLL